MDEQIFIDDERTVFLDALEESLRPLMRAVHRYGVSYQDLVEVVRALYTFAVRDLHESQGRPVTEARLAAMSGVTRGEVIKLVGSRQARAEQRAVAAKRLDQLTQLLGKWHDDPRFSTPYGAPLDLSLQPEGKFRTFDELVESTGLDLDRKSAMESLRATGCVEIHAGKFVRCITRSLRPGGKDLSKIARLGRIAGALNSNFVYNLLLDPDQPSFFEGTMVSDFPLSDVGRNAMLSQVAMDGGDFLEGVDKWVSTKAVDHMDESGHRYGVTAFFFRETPEAGPLNYAKTISSAADGNLQT